MALFTAALALLWPRPAAALPDPELGFATDITNNQVHIVNLGGFFEISKSVGITPTTIVFSPDGNFVFILNRNSSNITPIRVSDQVVLDPIPVSSSPSDLFVSPDSKFLYVVSVFRIEVIDLVQWATNPLDATNVLDSVLRSDSLNIPQVSAFPFAITAVGVSPDNASLIIGAVVFDFATGQTTGRIYSFDAANYPNIDASGGPTATFNGSFISPERQPAHIVFNSDGSRAFIADQRQLMVVQVAPIDLLQTISPFLPGFETLTDLRMRPDGQFLYGTPFQTSKIFEFDADNPQTLVRTINTHDAAAGEGATARVTNGVDFNPDSTKAYVPLSPRFGSGSFVRQLDLTQPVPTIDSTILLPSVARPFQIAAPAVAPVPEDTKAPTVTSISPAQGDEDVPINTNVQITFSESMAILTLQGAFSMKEQPSGAAVNGTFTLTPAGLIFAPSANLELESGYEVTMDNTATDVAGNALVAKSISFTSAILPFVESSSPSPDDLDVPVDSDITITFSEDMDQSNLAATFQMNEGITGDIVPGVVSFPTSKTLLFNPNDDLKFSTLHTVTIGLAARDLNGNTLEDTNRIFSFSTKVEPPQITITLPTLGSTVNGGRPKIEAVFTPAGNDLDLNTLELFINNPVTRPRIDAVYPTGSGNGVVGTAPNPLPQALAAHQMVAHNGFVYILGGFITFNQQTSQILKATVNPDGSLDSWSSAGQTFGPVSRAFAVNGKMYVFSGSGVFVADIDPNDGNLGSFSATEQPLFFSNGAVTLLESFDNFIYKISGFLTKRVEFSRITPDGTLTPWVETTSLPLAAGDFRNDGQAVTWRGRVYFLGGFDQNDAGSPKVFVAEADRSGHLGAWSETQGLPQGSGRAAANVSKGQILYFGGLDENTVTGAPTSNVFFTNINEDGTLDPWTTSSKPLPEPRFHLAAAASGDEVYVSGGVDSANSFQSTVFRTQALVGSVESVTAAFFPSESDSLDPGSHDIKAEIKDADGRLGSANSQFFVQEQPFFINAGDNLADLSSNNAGIAITPLTPDQVAAELDVAIAFGEQLPAPLSVYDLTPDGTQFETPAELILRWPDVDGDGFVDGTSAPKINENSLVIKRFVDGQWLKVVPQDPPDSAGNFIRAELFSASLYALFAPDQTPPIVSIVTPADGSVVTALSTPFILANYSDNTTIDVPSISLFFDDTDLSAQATITASTAAFTFAALPSEGTHVVTISVADTRGNTTTTSSSFTITTDTLPPVTAFKILGASATIGGTLFMAEISSVSLSAQDADSGVSRLEYRIDNGPLQTTPGTATFILTKGIHTIAFQAVDSIGNQEGLQAVTVSVNGTTPVTEFSVLGASAVVSGDLFIAATSSVSLSANDLGAGVAAMEFRIDGGSLQTTPGDALFTLIEGVRVITFQALDNVGNREGLRTETVRVDAAAPSTAFSIIGTSVVINGDLFITGVSSVSLSAQDAGAGVDRLEFRIDGGSLQTTSGDTAFTLAQGPHTITFQAVDRVGNRTAPRTETVNVDATAPVTDFNILGIFATVDGTLFMPVTSSVSLSAQDVGSGVAALEFRIDGGPLQITPGDSLFTLSKGTHTITFQARDKIGFVEGLRLMALTVNGTAPVTDFSVVGASAVIGGDLFMAQSSSVSLSAKDQGAGVERIEFGIDGGPLQTASGDALFNLSEGSRTVTFQAVDLVGNEENPRTKDVKVDGTAPLTQLTVDGSTVATGPITIFETTSLGFLSGDPVGNGVTSGVGFTEFSIDSNPFEVFSDTFSLLSGAHTLSFRSVDRVNNTENVQSVSVEVIRLVVTLDINPKTLNLKSKGQFVAAFIEVLGIKSAADIDDTTPRITAINDIAITPLPVDTKEPPALGDKDSDGIPELEVKFDRQDLIALLPIQEQVKITVEGSFKSGDTFKLFDFIRTIKPGKVPGGLGGTAAHPVYKAKVHVAAGALAEDVDITIIKISDAPDEEDDKQNIAANQKGIKRHGRPFEFGPEGTQFATPVMLTLPYEAVSLKGADSSALQIAYWNPKTEIWELLPSTVDNEEQTVSAPTSHFSKYQVVEAAAPAAGSSPAFPVGEVYVFPSPATGGAAPTFHIETAVGGSVSIHIYDVSGAQVHETTLTGSPKTIGQQLAYEYAWQARVASGVYLYVVRVEKNGEEVVRTGKFAIVR